jgi:hypothetical protein
MEWEQLSNDNIVMDSHAIELHKAPAHGWKQNFFELVALFIAAFYGFIA